MSSDDEQPEAKSDDLVTWRQALATVGIALSLPWTIAVPIYIGWRLDQWLHSWPLWFIVFLIIGLMAAGLDLYILLKRFGK